MWRSLPPVLVLLAAGLAGGLAGCATGHDPGTPPEGSGSAAPRPALPSPTLSGRLEAQLLQYSRDAAQGRMQVWLHNGTEEDVDPLAIRYDDPRLSRPIEGERLRTVPSGSRRGYPLPLPEPRCGPVPDRPPVVVVETTARRQRLPVDDGTEVVGRHVAARCLELAVTRVVRLSWAEEVPVRDGVGHLVLVAEPTGRPGRVRIESVDPTPVLNSTTGDGWEPELVVEGSGPARRVALPLVPNRCDGHAFLEAGGATAFRLHLSLDGERGQYVLRMTADGARAAIRYAVRQCQAERDD